MSQTTGFVPSSGSEALELEALVERLAVFHRDAALSTASADAGRQAAEAMAMGEVRAIQKRLEGDEDRARLQHLVEWLEQDIQRLAPVFEARRERLCRSWALAHPGSRLCHRGRVLLANAIGRDLTGPGAEFPADPASDLAALLVGLESRDERGLAHQALDHYLRLSGDYEAARLLSLWRACHALSGARRALERRPPAGQDPEHPALLAETMAECRHFLGLAESHAEFRFPPLVIAVGVCGSGKSRFTSGLVQRLGAVRLCSDVERRRLYGIDPQPSTATPPVDIFSGEATERTYRQLAGLAGMLLDAGLAACVDGTCLRRWQRDLLRQQAEARGLPCLLVSFEADEVTLRRRIEKRARQQGVAVAASLSVLARQQADLEPFADEERLHLVHLDTTADNAAETLAGLIQEHARLI
ncbi:AAA family ATPase [Halomonas sp. EGI 63088]|uniref:AAA family ATPase n=1 Tax=Halomonas flagellata TaxID=2920385 RepID=A0ABS9RTN2_9GAMM|nr:bifunctional aminoglycoside phosphotransferase/ATP-binding protein [Halomonas flagellata]MCH4563185.1 AAA family ATPase [Halomonas flagellata]